MPSFNAVPCSAYFPHYRPINFGYDVCPPGHTGTLRIINYYVVHYVFSGTGTFQTTEHTYHPQAGDMFIIRPDQKVYYAADEQDPWTYAWFDFYCDDPPAFLQKDVIFEPRLEQVFGAATKQSKNYANEERDAFLYGKLSELFGLLQLLYPTDEKPSSDQILHKAIQYMQQHDTENISVAEVAEYIHMDYFNFITLFNKRVGMTPGKFLTNQRLEYGSRLLIHDDKNTKEVADILGYNDVASFSRAFKKHYGMSPSQFTDIYQCNAKRKMR